MKRDSKWYSTKKLPKHKGGNNGENEGHKIYKIYRKQISKMAKVNYTLSIATLNVNGLNSSNKSQRLVEWT